MTAKIKIEVCIYQPDGRLVREFESSDIRIAKLDAADLMRAGWIVSVYRNDKVVRGWEKRCR